MDSIAYIGLGANLDRPRIQLTGARQALAEQSGLRLRRSSSLYRTAPVGGPEGQPDYLNAVIELESALVPVELLHCCQAIETRFGRRREERWGPRSLDLDLLLVDDALCDGPELILPHPRLHQRRFVLEPLLELAPDLRHPRLQRPLKDFLDPCMTQPVSRIGAW